MSDEHVNDRMYLRDLSVLRRMTKKLLKRDGVRPADAVTDEQFVASLFYGKPITESDALRNALKRVEHARYTGECCHLTKVEAGLLHTHLCRLSTIELFARKKDWKSIRSLTK